MGKEIIVSDDESIVEPNVHDATIRGLLLLSGKRLLISLETIEGGARCLVLHGVERLKVDGFREGNTVLDVTISASASLDPGDVADAYGVALSDKSFLPRILEKLRFGGFIIVRVNPSYGCSLVCVCRHVSVEDDVLPF